MKKTTFILALLFLLVGWQANSQIYLQENFDASIPATWTITDAGDATGDSWYSGQQGATNSLDGTNAAIVDSDAVGSGTLLVETLTSPVFDTSTSTALFLDFDQYYNNIGSDTAVVEVWDGTAWVAVLTQTSDAGGFNTPDQQHIDITTYANAAMQVRFTYNDANSWAWYWLVDNVLIYNSTCPNPTSLTVDNITTTSTDISWLAGGTETTWEIVVQPSGTGVPTSSGTTTTTTNTPYTDNTLSPSTNYEVYVRSDCSGDYSIWTGPVNFTTLNTPPPAPTGVTCATGSSTFIFTEDFGNDTNYVPSGWTGTAFTDTNGDWDITTESANSSSTGPDITWDGNPGTHLEYEGSGNTTNVASAITPAIDLSTAVDGAELSFYMHAFGGDMGTLNIGVSTSQTGPFTNEYTWVGDYQSAGDEAWVPIGVNLDAYLGQVIYIEISYVGTGDTWESDMAIDQVRVETCGDFCVAPTSITVDAITDTTADLSWIANNSETTWEVVVQAAGTGMPTTAGTTVTTNPYTATGLTASTAYEVYILANCGSGTSVWAGPINFTTLNTPPPAPTGVACATGSSTFIFTEDFGNDTNYIPSGWTGTGFDGSNGNWRITTENANSTSTGPNVTWNGNPGTHLEYESSGNATDIASAITPAIDLSTAIDGAELSFYMHAFGDDIGTLSIGVSTSQAGPFTNEYNWIGNYQNTADETWIPIGINLDAYLGQVIYVDISYGGSGAGFEGDLAIDQVRVEACGTFCIAPTAITATNITETAADISWTPSGAETEWNYVLQPAGTGVPTSGTVVTSSTISETTLNSATDYEVYIQALCGTESSTWAGPFNFSTLTQFNFILDCASDGPQTIDYCYDNNDTNVFTFSSTDGTPLNLTINAGQVENNFDEVIVLDSDGVTNLNAATPYGNSGQISGLTFQSTGDTISFAIESDISSSCQSSGYTSVNITVNCATCINQAVNFNPITDCTNGNNEFYIETDITSIGDAMSLNISDNQGSALQNTTTTGIITMGPYPLNTDVIITVENADDVNCIVTSNTINVPVCPPSNDECSGAIIVMPNADENCTNITNTSLYGATSSTQTSTCTGDTNDDVWFQFTAIATDHGISLNNIIGDTTNLDHALYEGTDCNSLTNIYCETTNNSTANGLIVGNTYFIRVFTAGDVAFQDVNFDLCVFTIPPPITTDDTQYTVDELVNNILVNSPCAIVNNVTSSTGTDFGGPNGIGYFEANGSGFPFESGIVMTTGNVLNAPGPETGTLSDGNTSWPGDTDLESFINQGPTNNASIIEFEFTPLIDELTFNFIFAAEEYGAFQCGFSDAFAFILTDITSGGAPVNIAVVPGTTDPVSVFTIRDNIHNTSCASSNPALFDAYYGAGTGLPAISNPTNFIGRTVPLTALATVIPNNTYSIKLVVADDGDTAFDSAVFLEASSFDIGEIDLGEDILLDSGLASCEGDAVTLDIGVPQPAGTVITWYTVGNGITEPIAGETDPTLTVNETGTYQVDIVFTGTSSACFYSDDVVVEFFENPEAETQTAILACDIDNTSTAVFDITENEANIIGTQTDVVISYFETEQDALDGTDPITSVTTYSATANTIIYFRVENTTTGCYATNTFNLELATKPVLVQSEDVIGCDNDEDGISEFDLTINETVISGGQTDLVYTYYTSLDDANMSNDPIINVTTYESPGAETIYIRAENTMTGCFETTTFDLVFGITPETTFDSTITYEVCPSATSPITITAEAVNYTASEVSIVWYNEGVIIPGANDLALNTVLTAGEYEIEVTFNDTGCSQSAFVEVTELETCIIPQGISPNNDGYNDAFDLSSFDVQSLEIFNRNGRKVYSKTNYTNQWEGQSDNGDMLPVGTYYYVMKYQGTKTKAAWVYLNR